MHSGQDHLQRCSGPYNLHKSHVNLFRQPTPQPFDDLCRTQPLNPLLVRHAVLSLHQGHNTEGCSGRVTCPPSTTQGAEHTAWQLVGALSEALLKDPAVRTTSCSDSPDLLVDGAISGPPACHQEAHSSMRSTLPHHGYTSWVQ